MLIATLPHRGTDDWGSGEFEAPRGLNRDKTPKLHKGIDYACYPGTEIYAPVRGRITKFGLPYANENYRYVEITDAKLARHRIFYVEISKYLKVKDLISVDDVIGIAQDIAVKYTKLRQVMKNHIHYEILVNNKPVNPESYV